jgi:hypothetical protein
MIRRNTSETPGATLNHIFAQGRDVIRDGARTLGRGCDEMNHEPLWDPHTKLNDRRSKGEMENYL